MGKMSEWVNKDKQQYTEEPVYYCTKCLSLKIRSVDDDKDSDYCDNCGSTEVSTTDIYTWQEKFQQAYGYNFLEGEKKKLY